MPKMADEGLPPQAQDDEKTLQQWCQAAAAGDKYAQYGLGLCCEEGLHPDYTQAAEWYALAAAQGHADAQFRLGLCYVNGQSVPQDYAKAAQWYTLAAAQSHTGAQFNLELHNYLQGH